MITSRFLIFLLLLLPFNLAHATGSDVQVKYLWTSGDGLTTIDFSIDNVGSYVIHNAVYDPEKAREQSDSQHGRILEAEEQTLQDLVSTADVQGLGAEYNNCAGNLSSSTITFEINNVETTVLIYEANDTLLKDCTAPKSPDSLNKILKYLKGLLSTYNKVPSYESETEDTGY